MLLSELNVTQSVRERERERERKESQHGSAIKVSTVLLLQLWRPCWHALPLGNWHTPDTHCVCQMMIMITKWPVLLLLLQKSVPVKVTKRFPLVVVVVVAA